MALNRIAIKWHQLVMRYRFLCSQTMPPRKQSMSLVFAAAVVLLLLLVWNMCRDLAFFLFLPFSPVVRFDKHCQMTKWTARRWRWVCCWQVCCKNRRCKLFGVGPFCCWKSVLTQAHMPELHKTHARKITLHLWFPRDEWWGRKREVWLCNQKKAKQHERRRKHPYTVS